jgi:N-acylneuraminate cytidylyltransferase
VESGNNRVIAVIPAKAYSGRVPNKNFREFAGGKSLLEIKLDQVVSSGVYDEVFVSSDNEEAKHLAEKCGATFVEREPRHTLDSTPWHEAFVGILMSLGEKEPNVEVSWIPVTNPLFLRFQDVLDAFRNGSEDYDSVFTTSIFKHFLINPDGLPVNFAFGPWAKYSQESASYRTMNCAFWHSTLGVMLANRYQIGTKPLMVDISSLEGWDIDTMEEFEVARTVYESRFVQR